MFIDRIWIQEKDDEEYIFNLIKKLEEYKVKIIILTGISYDENTTGVFVVKNGNTKYYKHRKISKTCHGTGDVYSSIFIGSYLKGMNVFDAACAAADFVLEFIEYTIKDKSHWYGVQFEPLVTNFIINLKNKYSIK